MSDELFEIIAKLEGLGLAPRVGEIKVGDETAARICLDAALHLRRLRAALAAETDPLPEPTIDMGLAGAEAINRHMRGPGAPADFDAAMDCYRVMAKMAGTRIRAAETERCAKVAEGLLQTGDDPNEIVRAARAGANIVVPRIAAAIREKTDE